MTTNVFEHLHHTLTQARQEIAKVIIGQSGVIDQALTTIFAGQHALIEGVPGIAKTLLVRTLAKVLGSDTSRIQFTPDLMPTDITGTNIFNLQKNQFYLQKGPVFTNFLLADEINRAPAKTQSALLQAMQERTVTIDRDTHILPANFTVFATQNPIEYEGTYPLPEAQKDRFMLKIVMDYPEREEEQKLANHLMEGHSPEQILESGEIKPVITETELKTLQQSIASVRFREELVTYLVDVIRQTRVDERLHVGAGPRATESLLLASRIRAALDGRDYVTPDDIKLTALGVLSHRLILKPEFEIEGLTVLEVIENLLQEIAVPR